MLKVLDHLEEWIIATLMGAATVIIFVAVLHRYMSGLAIPGVQDALIKINMSWAHHWQTSWRLSSRLQVSCEYLPAGRPRIFC